MCVRAECVIAGSVKNAETGQNRDRADIFRYIRKRCHKYLIKLRNVAVAHCACEPESRFGTRYGVICRLLAFFKYSARDGRIGAEILNHGL